MNQNSLKNLKPWPKGQSGNTKGRPGLPEELKGIASLTHQEVCKRISRLARMTVSELDSMMANPKLSIIERNIGAIFLESICHGDQSKLSFLLDRAIGKIKEVIPDVEEESVQDELKKLSLSELLTLVRENLPEAI